MRARPDCLVAACLLLAGCSTLATRQTAEPVPKGRWQLSAGADFAWFRDVPQDTKVPTGMAELGARYGVGGDVDLGIRLYTIGGALGAKWRFVNRSWMLAVAPEANYVFTSETATTTRAMYLFGHVPIIAGHRFSERVGINLGPKALYGFYYPETGGQAHGISIGTFFNTDVRVSRRWRLLPEISVYRTIAGEVPIDGWYGQIGTGLLLDL
jgi:hypothetical protein